MLSNRSISALSTSLLLLLLSRLTTLRNSFVLLPQFRAEFFSYPQSRGVQIRFLSHATVALFARRTEFRHILAWRTKFGHIPARRTEFRRILARTTTIVLFERRTDF